MNSTVSTSSQPAALRAIVANDSLVRAWLAEIEGRIVGYVVIALSFSIESGGRDGIIDEIFVVADARNRGLGHRILEMIEDEARSLGLMRLYLEVGHRNRAIGLYRRAGYLARPHYLMSKPL